MNYPETAAGEKRDSRAHRALRARGALPRAIRIIGVLVLIAGLQTWAFYTHFAPAYAGASEKLNQLISEAATNLQVNKVMRDLEDLRRVSENEGFRREIVVIYERFIKEFLDDPRMALESFSRLVAAFQAQPSTLGQESLATLRADLDVLEDIYRDHYGEFLEDYGSPPLYLQPTAAFVRQGAGYGKKAGFNHAVYLSVVGDRAAANEIFTELKQDDGGDRFMSRVHYAHARMLFGAFEAEGNFEYFQQAIQVLKQSLGADPGNGMAKLFLEYLLSLQSGQQSQDVQVEGDGSGEAEGEKGVISKIPPTF